jgi:allophanate hydrolase
MTEGVVPACRSFDCVSVFGRSVAAAAAAVDEMVDPSFGESVRTVRTDSPKFAVWPAEALSALSDAYRTAYADAVADVETVEVDPAPFIAAGRLLYDGAFVLERYQAVGAFIEGADPAEIDPTVRRLILDARAITPAQYDADVRQLDELRRQAAKALAHVDALLLPTAPFQPTIEEVLAEPVELNRRLGAYTTFCNLLGMCAVSVPAGRTADGGHFGVTLYGPHGHDARLAALAESLGE